MQDLPHTYRVSATAATDGDVALHSGQLAPIASAPPAEFGGPGDRWSPETLFVAAVADCFILTFRAIARASKLSWESVDCDVQGELERVERVTQFTELAIAVILRVPAGTDESRARRLLEKAEENCLITNSLKAVPHLSTTIEFAA